MLVEQQKKVMKEFVVKSPQTEPGKVLEFPLDRARSRQPATLSSEADSSTPRGRVVQFGPRLARRLDRRIKVIEVATEAAGAVGADDIQTLLFIEADALQSRITEVESMYGLPRKITDYAS